MKNRLQWFGHVQQRPIIEQIISDGIIDNGATRTREQTYIAISS